MKLVKIFATFLGFFLSVNILFAQDKKFDGHDITLSLPEVALLDLELNPAVKYISLQPSVPTEAGLEISFAKAKSNDLWLNYSSITVSKFDPNRSISVYFKGQLPNGTVLYLEADKDASRGDGAMGKPTGIISLSDFPQDIITGIGSSYTSDGVGRGHNLNYSLDLSPDKGSYSLLDADENTTITVIFTISDN
jgi:hypothetical protein